MKTKTEIPSAEALLGAFAETKLSPVNLHAKVGWVRSWDQNVFLVGDGAPGSVVGPGEPIKGFALMPDVYAFAIAAAAQASGASVVVEYASWDPNWGNGVGYIDGVKRVALDDF
jgi:hypothetical protein